MCRSACTHDPRRIATHRTRLAAYKNTSPSGHPAAKALHPHHTQSTRNDAQGVREERRTRHRPGWLHIGKAHLHYLDTSDKRALSSPRSRGDRKRRCREAMISFSSEPGRSRCRSRCLQARVRRKWVVIVLVIATVAQGSAKAHG